MRILLRTSLMCALIFLGASMAYAYEFNRNLSLGESGQDVLELQKILNSNPQTRVSETGVGSSGNETTYFGPLTHNAVIRYQNLYSKEILAPVALTYGTGYVGPSTRAELNKNQTDKALAQRSSKAITNSDTPSGSSGLSVSGLGNDSFFSELKDSRELLLFYPSSYVGGVGKVITLSGAGFEKKNTIYLGSHAVTDGVSSADGTSLRMSVPNIPAGMYSLRVKNSKGTTDTDAFFVVVDGTNDVPSIASVSPKKVTYGQTVTVVGTGFTEKNNEIRTSYGLIQGLSSSDGTTLTFPVEPYPEQMSGGRRERVDSFDWDISVTVINAGGVSNQAIFTLEF